MPYEPDEILAELGYSLIRRHIDLPKSNHPLQRLEELKQRIEESLPLVSLSSETARRETLVAPTLLENNNLTRGFTQLAVELIAISQVEEGDVFYGCVTIGDAWRFGILEKTNQKIFQDISLYRIPDDLEDLMRILVGILA
jgi:hypothetical protein